MGKNKSGIDKLIEGNRDAAEKHRIAYAKEYAEQEAIGFFIWNARQVGDYLNFLKIYQYKDLTEDKKEEIEQFETATVPQRYQLYLKSKEQKQAP